MEKKLDKYVEEALYYYDLPGLCVSVSKGAFAYKKAVGFKNFITKEPLATENVFHLCSVSKLFTATGIMQLWEAGRLTPNTKLAEVLPWFTLADERFKSIELRHMLSHTSGIGDVDDYHWDRPRTDEAALKDYAMSDEVRQSKLLFDPSEGKFSYSNIAYELLGCIIAEVSGLSFEDYMQKHILEPLGMEASTFLTFERKEETLAMPYVKDRENHIQPVEHYPYTREHAPSSTLTSNLADLEKWGKAHLGRTLLKEETYKAAFNQYAEVPNNGEGMGYSWFIRKQNGFTLFGHEGTDDGFRSSFWICPELDCQITVLSNLSKSPVKRISKQLFNLLTKEDE